MKTIIFSLSLLLTINCFSQRPISNFFIEDNELVYKRIFEYPGKSSNEIRAILIRFLPSVPALKNISANDDFITADLSNLNVNYKKYGVSDFDPTWLPYPLNAKIIIQIKNDKYRVLAKDMYFDLHECKASDNIWGERCPLKELLLVRRYTEFRSHRGSLLTMEVINKYFSDIFNLNNKPKEKENW